MASTTIIVGLATQLVRFGAMAPPRGEPAQPIDDPARPEPSTAAPVDAPDATDPAATPDADASAPEDAPPDPPASEREAEGFFGPAVVEPDTASPADDVPDAPPMPEVETLPSRRRAPAHDGRGLFALDPPAEDRPPAGTEGGSFFDPGKLHDSAPGGGALQIRGFVAANFFTTMRSDLFRRDAQGRFRRLDPLTYFDVSSATLYFGAPIFADVVYARIALELLSIPQRQDTGGTFDIIAQSRRFLFLESAAIEINPFAWASTQGRWFREGFKITAGVFIVPFGIEDEEHAAPANWFITRPLAMTNGRVYPGAWVDVGAVLKWKPTFREHRPVRPLEIDVGVVNGDPCTQTRFLAQLYTPSGLVPTCERKLRQGELAAGLTPSAGGGGTRADNPLGFSLNDNNQNKALVGRVQLFPLPALNFGGSVVWAKHPEGAVTLMAGQSPADLDQARSWRVGAHLDLNLDQIAQPVFPLPHLRGEVVYGVDEAVDRPADERQLTDRKMLGIYAQIAQPLFRRKKTRLPGLIVQYRFDFADPDLQVPGTVGGVPLVSDVASALFPAETAMQRHTVGLRLPVLPRFTLKTEYTFALEDGGENNQIANDLFGLEAVVDF